MIDIYLIMKVFFFFKFHLKAFKHSVGFILNTIEFCFAFGHLIIYKDSGAAETGKEAAWESRNQSANVFRGKTPKMFKEHCSDGKDRVKERNTTGTRGFL